MGKRAVMEDLWKQMKASSVTEVWKVLKVGHIVDVAVSLMGKTKYERVFGNIDKSLVAASVKKAVAWIMSDRISEGIGRGGWAKSEKAWMTHVFGEEAGSGTKEAVFSTVVAMEALKAHTKLQGLQSEPNGCYQWDAVVKQLIRFMIDDRRYSEGSGKAGKFGAMGADGGHRVNYDYRHTAIILRLWNLQSSWMDNYQLTARALVECFGDKEFVDWKTERVVTLVMAHKALTMVKASSTGPLVDDVEQKLEVIRGKIVEKFDNELCGWPAKSEGGAFSREQYAKSRNYYTLLALTMISEEWDGNNDELKEQMARSLEETFCRYLRSYPDEQSFYICRPDSNRPDLCATLIAFSALARKTKLSKEELLISQGISRYIVRRFREVNFDDSNPYDCLYGWVVPYFVMDACKILLDEKV